MMNFNIGDQIFFITVDLKIASGDTMKLRQDTVQGIKTWQDSGTSKIQKTYTVSYGFEVPYEWCYATKQECIDAIKNAVDDL